MISLDSVDFNDKIDFIKIDTEGSELYVLQGAKSIINHHKPLIQVETNLLFSKNYLIMTNGKFIISYIL